MTDELNYRTISPDNWARLRAGFTPSDLVERRIAQNEDGTYVLLQPELRVEALFARFDNVLGPGGYAVTAEPVGYGNEPTVRCRLQLGATSRVAIAGGATPDEAYGAALRQAAAHFGIGRRLYETGPYWAEVQVQVVRREPAAQALLDPGQNRSEHFGPLGLPNDD